MTTQILCARAERISRIFFSDEKDNDELDDGEVTLASLRLTNHRWNQIIVHVSFYALQTNPCPLLGSWS